MVTHYAIEKRAPLVGFGLRQKERNGEYIER